MHEPPAAQAPALDAARRDCIKFALPPHARRGGSSRTSGTRSKATSRRRAARFADEGTTEEKAREEYRGIAERRVRLGLVLAEIGERNNITVTDEEMTRAIVERARRSSGPGAAGVGFLSQESRARGSAACADLRGKGGRFPAPRLATVTDEQVSREELLKDDEDEKNAASSGGSEVRIISAASPKCGLLNQSHTRSISC